MNVGRGARYNLEDDECEWPINLRETKVKPCKFKMIEGPTFNYRNHTYQLVMLPKGTKLYHGVLFRGGKRQSVRMSNFMWFTSTLDHQGNINSTHIFEFTVEEPLLLIYEPNITLRYRKFGPNFRGKEYQQILNGINLYHKREFGIPLDGYIGCNECEIGIYAKAFMDKLGKTPELVQEKDIKWID